MFKTLIKEIKDSLKEDEPEQKEMNIFEYRAEIKRLENNRKAIEERLKRKRS